ncbi:hypothetical protein KC222_20940 [Cedecea davisae]|uniref:Flagellar protein FliT n=1 Tax=Cedecea davisae TaxID=158484 RepID=A0ABS6DP39_9ENTR|nr:hypothetical protein [Cedecea davisae]MBU4684465.1 hypothetical protein [Cedecea davisae]MBU4688689.1 hypothetical protein [Cedecea davisae]
MDDIQVIRFLTRALAVAAQEENWSQVQEVDKQIASLLASLGRNPLTDAKRVALEELRRMHHKVNEKCRLKSEELERKMALQRRNQEGVAAYAVFMDEEDIR